MLIKDIEKMEAYTPTEYVNDSEPDLDADNLNKTETQLRDTVAKANEIIDTLKSLISNVSVNSEDTVPSSAVAYKMEQDIEQLNSNISGLINHNIFVGTYVYNGESTQGITIQDNRIKNTQYKLIATCQDIGNPVSTITSIQGGSFVVVLMTAVTSARINYIGFELWK